MSDAVSTQLGAYAGYISLAIAIGAMIVGVVNRKRIKSECCGRVGTVSLSIDDNTSPKGEKVEALKVDKKESKPPSDENA
jgi:hypothetical protein